MRSANSYDFPKKKKDQQHRGVVNFSVSWSNQLKFLVYWNWLTVIGWNRSTNYRLKSLIGCNCLKLVAVSLSLVQSPSVGMRYFTSIINTIWATHQLFCKHKLLHTSRMQRPRLRQGCAVKNKKLLLCHKNSTTGQCCCSYGQACMAWARSENGSTATL